MSTAPSLAAPRRRTLASVLATALVAAVALVGGAIPAAAVTAEVSGASLSWGVKQSFRSYIASPIANGTATTSGGVSGTGPYTWSSGSGTTDNVSAAADARFTGGVSFSGHDGQLDVRLTNPRVVIEGTGGTLYVDSYSKAMDGSISEQSGVAFATLTVPQPSNDGATITFTGIQASLTAAGRTAFANFYEVGTALDPLNLTLPYTVPAAATSTTLTSSANPATVGQDVTLTATVTPAAAGTVTFKDGATTLGTSPVSGGTATLTTSALSAGSHALTAEFAPADSSHLASTSATLTQVVNAAAPTATTTTLAVTPNPATADEDVSLTATVAPADAAGTVTFFEGTTAVGSAPVVSGQASATTSTLAVGSHTLRAEFAPSAATHAASTSSDVTLVVEEAVVTPVFEPEIEVFLADGVTPYNGTDPVYNGDTLVVKGSGFDPEANVGGRGVPVPNTLPQGNYVVLGAFAENWKPSTGAPSTARKVVSQKWALTEDTLNQVPASFQTTVRNQWVELTQDGEFTATLTVASPTDAPAGAIYGAYTYGAGGVNNASQELSATVNYQGDRPVVPVADPKITVTPAGDLDPTVENVLTISGTGYVGAGAANGAYVLFGETSVWSGNAPLPGSGWIVQAHVPAPQVVDGAFTTTLTIPANSLDATKTYNVATSAAHWLSFTDRTLDAFAPVTVKAPVVTPEPVITVTAPATVKQGAEVTFTGSGFAPGERVGAVVSSDPVDLGTQAANPDGVVAFTWTVPSDFEIGQHTITLTGATSGSDAAPFAVEAAAVTPEPETPQPGEQCQAIASGSLSWGVKESFRTYVTGPIASGSITTSGSVTASGGQYTWTGGAGTFSPDARTGEAAFTGQVAFDGHGGQLALKLTNPRVQITSATTATLLVDVSSKALNTGAVTDTAAVPFAQIDLSGASISGSQISVVGASVTLTQAGSENFAGFYSAGTALDPITFSLPLGASTECVPPTPPGGNPGGSDTGNGDTDNGNNGASPGNGSTTAPTTSGTSSTPADVKCVAQGVGGGTLSWGVKASFRTYVTGPIAGGSISTSGVSQSGGAFVWGGGNGAYNAADNKGRVAYSGTLSFSGHSGQLDLKISNPRVQVNGTGSANLIADITSKGLNGPDVAKSGVVIATLALPASSTSDGKISWSGASATLTAAGAEAFGGFYQAGTAMDPVSFSFPLGGDVECTSATGTLAATGADAGTSAALGALGLLLAGMVLVAARRRSTTA